MDVVGCNGENVSKHWTKYDGPAAYNCSALSGFPNFFMLLGPNAATGHTSAMMAAEKYVKTLDPFKLGECNVINPHTSSINYALRILKPVFNGDAVSVDLKPQAEHDYVYWMQGALSKRVWNAGCISVSSVAIENSKSDSDS